MQVPDADFQEHTDTGWPPESDGALTAIAGSLSGSGVEWHVLGVAKKSAPDLLRVFSNTLMTNLDERRRDSVQEDVERTASVLETIGIDATKRVRHGLPSRETLSEVDDQNHDLVLCPGDGWNPR